ncbi:MAG: hypothetical protein K0R38_6493 [Polyangiaceae bacterium]|jgi:hypothetical protein|nr:hypothetical protein [Polyangiaceae bacterium]
MDEPAPGGLEQVVVNPIWPLLASMFAGAWLAYPWFVLNSFALGGRRRFVDLSIALGGLLLTALTLFVVALLVQRGTVQEAHLPYFQLIPVGVRLVIFYLLFMRQEQSFALYTYFGGKTRNAFLVVIAASFLKGKLLGDAPPIVQLLLG